LASLEAAKDGYEVVVTVSVICNGGDAGFWFNEVNDNASAAENVVKFELGIEYGLVCGNDVGSFGSCLGR